jgi:hypothetical protein
MLGKGVEIRIICDMRPGDIPSFSQVSGTSKQKAPADFCASSPPSRQIILVLISCHMLGKGNKELPALSQARAVRDHDSASQIIQARVSPGTDAIVFGIESQLLIFPFTLHPSATLHDQFLESYSICPRWSESCSAALPLP